MATYKFEVCLLCLLCVSNISCGLRILLVLPSYGGHFGTLAPLGASLSQNHEVTILQTSPSCEKKLAPFQQVADFKIIKEDLTFKDIHFENFLQGVRIITEEMPRSVKKILAYLNNYLAKNRNNFDIMLADPSQEGAFIAAEVADIPVVVVMSGFPGGVENVIDKMEIDLVQVVVTKLMAYNFRQMLADLRKDNNLTEIVNHGGYYVFDYVSRFPSLVATSPTFYPEIHPSIRSTYLGGLRIGAQNAISDDLQTWLTLDNRNVLYLSLGTHFTLTDEKKTEFVQQLKKQGNYKVIWSLGKMMQKAIHRLEISSDELVFFSDFLPQYTLLGHENVKVFVTHGGLGSVIDLVKHGKPSVCAPQIFDQFFNCKRLQSLSIAETVSSFNFEAIISAVEKILGNYESYVTNTRQLRKEFEFYESRDKIDLFLTEVASKGKVEVVKDLEFKFCSQRCDRAWVILQCIFVGIVAFLGVCIICVACCLKRTSRRMKID